MDHEYVRSLDLPSIPIDRLQDLLVDASLEAQFRPVAEEFDMIDDGEAVLAGSRRDMHLHQIAGYFFFREKDQIVQSLPAFGRESVVGVHPKKPISRCVGEGDIASGGEVVAPGEEEDLCAMFPGDLYGSVGRAGVYENDLIHVGFDARKAVAEDSLFILDDHAEAN